MKLFKVRFFNAAIILFTLLTTFSAHAQVQISPSNENILYVDLNAQGTGDGSNWNDAIPELADALKWAKYNFNPDASTEPLKIFVAVGTYFPKYSSLDDANMDLNGDHKGFVMLKNVQLYGGFNPANGIENLTHNRIISANTGNQTQGTILNGNNNSIVLISAGDLGTALVDGFSITNGNAYDDRDKLINQKSVFFCSGGGTYNSVTTMTYKNMFYFNNFCGESGGAMFSYLSNITLDNLRFENNSTENHGGAIAFQNLCNVTITNSTFTSNSAKYGGAIYHVDTCQITLKNCILSNNTATNVGGAIHGDDMSHMILSNCLLSENSASELGGAIYDSNKGYSTITNVTFSKNSAEDGGAIFNDNTPSQTTIYNSIIWGNIADTNTEISSRNPNLTILNSYINATSWNADWGASNTSNILSLDNPFVDSDENNFQLNKCTKTINSGNISLYENNLFNNISLTDVDLAGNSRVYGGTIDIGAYELQSIVIPVHFELGEDQILCQGDLLTIDATNMGILNYLWSTEETTSAITVSEEGYYSISITDTNLCKKIDSLYVSVVTVAVNLGLDDNYCEGVEFTKTIDAGNPGFNYLWNNQETSQSITVTSIGTYSVKVTDENGCYGIDTVIIASIANPIINIGSDTVYCEGSNFSKILDAGNPTATYLWNNQATTQTIVIDTAGTYSVIVTSTDGCSSSDTIHISESAAPKATNLSFTNDWTNCSFNFTIEDPENINSYYWNFGDGSLMASNIPSASHTYDTARTYTVVVELLNNCGSIFKETIISCSAADVKMADINQQFSIYPNPASSTVTILNTENITLNGVYLIDLLGKIVLTPTINNLAKIEIDLDNIADGFYTILMTTEKGIITKKLEILKK